MNKSFLKTIAIALTAVITSEALTIPLAQAEMMSPAPMAAPHSKISSQSLPTSLISKKITEPFRVPATMGSTVEVYAPAHAGRLVYHFQDVHNNVPAQTNLADMISALEAYAAKQNKYVVVAVEGSAGQSDTDSIARLSNQKAKEDVGAGLLRAGYMMGEEYAAITHAPGRIKIVGVEGLDLYVKNGTARDNSIYSRRNALRTIREIRAQLDKLAQHNFNSKLMDVEKQRRGVEDGSLPLSTFINTLNAINPAVIRAHPHMARLASLHQTEAGIDFPKVEREGKLLVQEVMTGKSEKEMERLVEDAQALKEGRLSPLSYYSILLEQSRRSYPEIKKYVAYLSAAEKIDPDVLFVEVETATDEIAKGLVKHPLAMDLYSHLRWADHQQKFFALNLIPQEWELVRNNSVESINERRAAIETFTREQVNDLGYTFTTPAFDQKALKVAVEGARSFYEAAEQRNDVMVSNLEKVLADAPANEAVVAFVAGGFHTPGITKIFKSLGIAYEVIRPQLETETFLSEEVSYPVKRVHYRRDPGATAPNGQGTPGTPAIVNTIQDNSGEVAEQLKKADDANPAPAVEPQAAGTPTLSDEIKGALEEAKDKGITLDPKGPKNFDLGIGLLVKLVAIVAIVAVVVFRHSIRALFKGKTATAPTSQASSKDRVTQEAMEARARKVEEVKQLIARFVARNQGRQLATPVNVVGNMEGWPAGGLTGSMYCEVFNALSSLVPFSGEVQASVVLAHPESDQGILEEARAAVTAVKSPVSPDKAVAINLSVSSEGGFNVGSILTAGGVAANNINDKNTAVVSITANEGFAGQPARLYSSRTTLEQMVRSFVVSRYAADQVDKLTEELLGYIEQFPGIKEGNFTQELINELATAIMA